MSKIAFGSPVTTCDCLLTGRVTMIWFVPPRAPRPQTPVQTPDARTYYRIQFPPHSPFLDDWAVYRAHEVAAVIESPPLIKIVALMRPKVPR